MLGFARHTCQNCFSHHQENTLCEVHIDMENFVTLIMSMQAFPASVIVCYFLVMTLLSCALWSCPISGSAVYMTSLPSLAAPLLFVDACSGSESGEQLRGPRLSSSSPVHWVNIPQGKAFSAWQPFEPCVSFRNTWWPAQVLTKHGHKIHMNLLYH